MISRPVASTASRIPLLTARSRPRSAVSGRKSDLRTCVEITSRGRLEMPIREAAGSTGVSFSFDVPEVIIDTVKYVWCALRASCACVFALPPDLSPSDLAFSSDVTNCRCDSSPTSRISNNHR